jgi:hypothetical protein
LQAIKNAGDEIETLISGMLEIARQLQSKTSEE